MTAADLLTQLLAGLSRAGLLFIVSAGLSLVFGALRVINLAHGSLYMLGAFAASTIVAGVSTGINFPLAVATGALVAAFVGVALETGVLRRLYRGEHLLQLLATYAVVLMLSDVTRLIWGSQNRSVPRPAPLRGSVVLGDVEFARYNLFVILVALSIGAGLYLLVHRTPLGRDIRAAIADPEMLQGVGVDVPRLFTVVFVIGSALAGIAGAVVAPAAAVGLGMDVDIIVQAFAVTIIGGLGSIPGALIGATIVGLVDAFGILFVPRLALALIFLAMALVLAVRPSGLFGVPERT